MVVVDGVLVVIMLMYLLSWQTQGGGAGQMHLLQAQVDMLYQVPLVSDDGDAEQTLTAMFLFSMDFVPFEFVLH